MIMIALSIAVLMLLPKRDIGFGLAVAWAFFGIYSKQIDGTAPIVAQVAGLGVVVVLVMATIAGIRIVRSQGRSPFM